MAWLHRFEDNLVERAAFRAAQRDFTVPQDGFHTLPKQVNAFGKDNAYALFAFHTFPMLGQGLDLCITSML
jgi:hypothetical protein